MIDSHGGPREGGDIRIGPSLEHGHPTAQKYVAIGVILAIITALEVAVYYLEIGPLLPPILLVLSAVKFSLVVLFFMHLKFDSRLFSSFFVGGLLLAGAVLIALMALFNHFFA
ncbi:MAG TPA: cytochrome C oxidase subunit IV family protein [Chloroflexota bacterium]|nr:cytochrome C oxidase subunit IV family protein [Chloroflexota bacterium]